MVEITFGELYKCLRREYGMTNFSQWPFSEGKYLCVMYLWNDRKTSYDEATDFQFEHAYLGLISILHKSVYRAIWMSSRKKKRKEQFRQRHFNIQTAQSFLHKSLDIIKC